MNINISKPLSCEDFANLIEKFGGCRSSYAAVSLKGTKTGGGYSIPQEGAKLLLKTVDQISKAATINPKNIIHRKMIEELAKQGVNIALF